MTTQRRTRRRSESDLLDDEADIVDEGAAENDDENDEEAPESGSHEPDPDDVNENRRRRQVVAKKKSRKTRVNFGTKDPLEKYDMLLNAGHSATDFEISVKRISGGPGVRGFIMSRPGSGRALLEAIETFHTQHGGIASEYWLRVTDAYNKRIFCQGPIAMPDTRQGTASAPYYQPQAPAPQPQAAPAVQPEQRNPLSEMEQAFDFFERMRGRVQPQSAQAPQQPPIQIPAGMPSSMGDMMRMFEFFERLRPQPQLPQPAAPAPQPTQPQPAPQQERPMGMPTFDPPAGTQWMYDPRGGWVAVPVPGQEPRGRPRPQYEPQEHHEPFRPGAPSRFGHRGPIGPQEQPQRQKTAAEMLRETITTVKSAAAVIREFEEIMPGSTERVVDEGSAEQPQDDGNPYMTQKFGEIDVLRDPEGEIAVWPSLAVNLPKAVKFLGDTYEKLQKNAVEQRQRQGQQRVLPPGHIEVIPGQTRIPEGYRAVPVDQEEAERVEQAYQQPVVTPEPAPQQQLPPVPENIPPPIQDQPAPQQPAQQPPQRVWGLPSIPEGE